MNFTGNSTIYKNASKKIQKTAHTALDRDVTSNDVNQQSPPSPHLALQGAHC